MFTNRNLAVLLACLVVVCMLVPLQWLCQDAASAASAAPGSQEGGRPAPLFVGDPGMQPPAVPAAVPHIQTPPPRKQRDAQHPAVAHRAEGCERPLPHLPLCASKPVPATPKYNVSCVEYTQTHWWPNLYQLQTCYILPLLEKRLSELPCDPQPVAEPLYFHTYWSGKPFYQMEYIVYSFLVTQDLSKCVFNFWTDDLGNPDFQRFVALFEPYKEYVNFLEVDVRRDSKGTCLEGKEHFLDPKVDNIDKRVYSDLVRVLLLARYGGVWIDIDMFLYRDIRPLVRYFGNFASAAFKDGACAQNNYRSPGCWNNAILSLRADGPMRPLLLEKLCQLPYRSWRFNKPHPELKPQFGGWAWNEALLQLCALNRPGCYIHAMRKTIVDPIWGGCLRARRPKLFGGGMSTGFCRERADLGPVDPINPPREMFYAGYTVHSRITQCGKEGPHTVNNATSLFSRVFAIMDHVLRNKVAPIEPRPLYKADLDTWDAAIREGRVNRDTGKIRAV